MFRGYLILPCVYAALAGLGGCTRSAPANVAATVNGRPITYAELDKQLQIQFPTPAERDNDEQL